MCREREREREREEGEREQSRVEREKEREIVGKRERCVHIHVCCVHDIHLHMFVFSPIDMCYPAKFSIYSLLI